MHKYVIRRLQLAIPVLMLSSLIVFGLMRVLPGDALVALMGESGNVGERELAKLRKDLGLALAPVPDDHAAIELTVQDLAHGGRRPSAHH